MALWSLFSLAMLAVAVHSYVMPYAEVSGKLVGRTQMYYAANAGVERAIFEVENDATEKYDSLRDSWSDQEAAFKDVTVGGRTFSVIKENSWPGAEQEYGLTDEEGKINVNKASQSVLENLFEKVAQVEPEAAESIAESILDWRDADDDAHEKGKENGYYRSLEHPYDCKNSDFEVKEELRSVNGVTPEIFEKVKNYITVYGDGVVNINTASVPVLVALGMDEAVAEKIVHFRAASSSPQEGAAPEGIFTEDISIADFLTQAGSFSADEVAQTQRLLLLGVKSDNFRGHVIGSSAGGRETSRIVFVYDRKERRIKFWREMS
jgi:general secretion pathway protein K